MGTSGSIGGGGLEASDISADEPATWDDDTSTIGVDVPGIDIGQTTGNLPVSRVPDAIPTSQEGVANGVATLGPDGKVPASELNVAGGFNYLGSWDASSNTPTLADGTGSNGDIYKVSTAGTQDLGSGPIVFQVGDHVVHDGNAWENFGSSEAVSSVAGKTGVVILVKADVGLGNVDNTSDIDKPVSAAQAMSIALRATEAQFLNHVNNLNNPHSVTKAQVGLSNVDNTSDANKPLSNDAVHALAERLLVSDLADEAEAQAGTDDSKWMSPLKTKQAIAALGGTPPLQAPGMIDGASQSLGDSDAPIQMILPTGGAMEVFIEGSPGKTFTFFMASDATPSTVTIGMATPGSINGQGTLTMDNTLYSWMTVFIYDDNNNGRAFKGSGA